MNTRAWLATVALDGRYTLDQRNAARTLLRAQWHPPIATARPQAQAEETLWPEPETPMQKVFADIRRAGLRYE